MRLATPFDPIEVGEIDNFAFDFTADMGASIDCLDELVLRTSPVSDCHRSDTAVSGTGGFGPDDDRGTVANRWLFANA